MNLLRGLHPVPLLAGLVVSILGVQLGNWQVRRAEEKTELGERVAHLAAVPATSLSGAPSDGAVEEWQRVSVAGEWLPQGTIFLDNRVPLGRPGFHVLTPLRLAAGGDVVLVNRGWVAAGLEHARLPEVTGVAGAGVVEGLVRYPQPHPFSLARKPAEGRLWQFLDLPAYRQAFGLPVAAFLLQETSVGPDGLVRDWPRPDAGIDRHWGYAAQWYGLAATAAAMTGLYMFRKLRRPELSPS